jgi:hypothetical protein
MRVPHIRQHPPSNKPKLLDQVRAVIRRKHYSVRTEEAYLNWIKRYILFHKKRHPSDMAGPEVEQFLNHLAVQRIADLEFRIADFVYALLIFRIRFRVGTEIRSLNSKPGFMRLVFLFREVLDKEMGWMDNLERA